MLITIVVILGMIINCFSGNDTAFYAYLLASIAWLSIATDEAVRFFIKKV
jgi:hypothetical protein